MAVRREREARGWSQAALANVLRRELDLNVGGQSGVARIEAGERPTRLNEVVSIARFLGVDLPAVMTGTVLPWTKAEELEVALVRARAQLEETQAAVEAARLDVIATRVAADEATKRHAQLRAQLAELSAMHEQLVLNLDRATVENAKWDRAQARFEKEVNERYGER